MEAIITLVIVTIILCIYYVPFLVAEIRKIKNKTSVFWLNTFFGWSGIGWFVLLFYSSLVNNGEIISINKSTKKKFQKRNKLKT